MIIYSTTQMQNATQLCNLDNRDTSHVVHVHGCYVVAQLHCPEVGARLVLPRTTQPCPATWLGRGRSLTAGLTTPLARTVQINGHIQVIV